MEKIRVGVLRGGISPEYEVSLKTGDSVLRHLDPNKYLPLDMLITKDGTWHINGIPTDLVKVNRRVDVVFNALHGEYGEDGKVQRLFEHFGLPFTGSGALASASGMNKVIAKSIFQKHGLKVAPHMEVSHRRLREDVSDDHMLRLLVLDILQSVPLPLIAKPVSGGSSVGTYKINTPVQLLDILITLSECPWDILFEQFIKGKEATVGVIENFRGVPVYSLLPIEIRPPANNPFFDFESKYNGKSEEIVPGNFSREESADLQDLAKRAHSALRLRHYSRSDFIIGEDGIYILETNTLPGLTDQSLLPKSLHSVGSNLPEFLDHIITLARS